MDPLSTSFIPINTAALLVRISSLARVVKGLQEFEEPSLDRIRIGLLTEATQFRIWCRQTGVDEGGFDHMQSRLPPDARQAAVVIVHAFEKWMSKSVISLQKHGIKFDSQNPIDEPGKAKDLGTIAKRVMWRLNGYKDLDEMLRTLQGLNKGLRIICKPILSYDDDRINELIKSVDNLVTRLPSYTEITEIRIPNTSKSAKPRKAPSLENIKANAQSFPSQAVFIECCKLLSAILVELETHSEYKPLATQLRSAHVRMKIWGCCVFEVPFHLDQIMTKEHDKEQALRSSITGILADLTLTVENFLERLLASKSSSAQEILLRSQVVFSIHEDVFEHSLDLPDEFYEASDPIGEAVVDYVDEIVGFVDCLYQTIPFVRRMQDIYYLELESKASNVISDIESQGVSIEQPEVQTKSDKASFNVEHSDSQYKPVKMVVDTTQEMMTAIQVSIKEAQERDARSFADSQALDNAMKEIEEWDKQIERMKAWSSTLSSLSPDQDSPEAVEHNIKIVQALATMACDVANTAPSKDSFPIEMLKPQINDLWKQLRMSDRVVEKVTQDIKIEEKSKTLAEAFQAVQLGNKAIEDEVGQLAASKPKIRTQQRVTHAIPVL